MSTKTQAQVESMTARQLFALLKTAKQVSPKEGCDFDPNRRFWAEGYAGLTGKGALARFLSDTWTREELDGAWEFFTSGAWKTGTDKAPVRVERTNLADLTPRPVSLLDEAIRTVVREEFDAKLGDWTPPKDENPAGADEETVKGIVADMIEARVPKTIIVQRADSTRVTLSDTELRHAQFEEILSLVAARIPVLLIGPAGSGKSTVCRQVAKALGRPFDYSGAIANEYKLTGFIDAQGRPVRTAYFRSYTGNAGENKGGLFLLDEIDCSNPTAVKAFLNNAMENGHADFPDGLHARAEEHVLMGAANTYGTGRDRTYVGGNQLDGSTLDRFFMVEFGYDQKLELAAAKATGFDGAAAWVGTVQLIRAAVEALKLRVIVGPRASILGARAQMAGRSREETLSGLVFRGLDADTVRRVRAEAGV